MKLKRNFLLTLTSLSVIYSCGGYTWSLSLICLEKRCCSNSELVSVSLRILSYTWRKAGFLSRNIKIQVTGVDVIRTTKPLKENFSIDHVPSNNKMAVASNWPNLTVVSTSARRCLCDKGNPAIWKLMQTRPIILFTYVGCAKYSLLRSYFTEHLIQPESRPSDVGGVL